MTIGKIELRRVPVAQALPYRAMMLEAYEQHPDAFTSSVAERAALPIEWWQQRLADTESAKEWVLGAFSDGVLAGVAGLAFESREKANHKATLFGMYVPQAMRGQGIAQQLVDATLELARTRDNVKLIQLTVTEGNVAAENLYAGCGFERFGVEPFAVRVGSAFVSKVHMWRML